MNLYDKFNDSLNTLMKFCKSQVENILANEPAVAEQKFLIYLNILCSLNANSFEDDSFV